ncbi:MAG TPA: KH domain-containing protein [Thermoanaerobaculia bacterium]|jgi:predicted RNA-binding protein YlqC (UPF0109 family)|nr:KH domain-containing protein [Thermoanaerobaculia bacterium]
MADLGDQLEDLIRLLVDEPDEVEIYEVEEDDALVYEVETAEDDVGKVIGRRGSTVRALRTLLDARAAFDDELYELEVVD